MRVVLDEALPRKLASLLTEAGCLVEPFPAGWKGLKDGDLLTAMQAEGCAVLLTCDRNMAHQQTFSDRALALIVVPGQRLHVLATMVEEIVHAVRTARPGTVTTVGSRGRV